MSIREVANRHNRGMTKPKHVVVAINPNARFGTSRAVGPAVVSTLRALGYSVSSLTEPDFAQLKAASERAMLTRPDAVIVVGGDGMVNLGTNLVAGTRIPLGIIPSGTGNDMARGLDIPIDNVDAAIDTILAGLEGEPRVIDAVKITDNVGKELWFSCMVSAGFDAIVNERANGMGFPKGKNRYLVALALELATFKPISYRLVLDGQVIETKGMIVSVGNNVSLGGGMKVTPNAIVDDGLVDVLVLRPLSRLGFLRIFPRVFKGTHITDHRVSVYRARKVRLEAEGVIAYADGERVGPMPIDLEVIPGALRVLSPIPTRTNKPDAVAGSTTSVVAE
jgi:diacylglycerol kinase (ATP)